MDSQLENILYVEDEPDIQAIAKISLENIGGFKIRIANTGAQALDELESYTPQLILMDVMMPELDGISTLGRLKEDKDRCSIPVIFMTAKAQPQEIESYRGMGAIDVITKPFDPMTLPDRVKEIWNNFTLN